MDRIHKILYDFWSGFSYDNRPIPAFISGHVPKGRSLPYFTFEVGLAPTMGKQVLTAFLWVSAQKGNLERAEILELVRKAIPTQGKLLPGGIAIYPNQTDFISYYDSDEQDVVGARVSYEAHFYL